VSQRFSYIFRNKYYTYSAVILEILSSVKNLASLSMDSLYRKCTILFLKTSGILFTIVVCYCIDSIILVEHHDLATPRMSEDGSIRL
jgi:hypothetical protein